MAGTPPVGGPAAGGGLFGGQLQGSSTPKVAASMLGNRSLTLPKGTAFTCVSCHLTNGEIIPRQMHSNNRNRPVPVPAR